jgi:arabinan endo-1,5-alpha-L-arabinosidase
MKKRLLLLPFLLTACFDGVVSNESSQSVSTASVVSSSSVADSIDDSLTDVSVESTTVESSSDSTTTTVESTTESSSSEEPSSESSSIPLAPEPITYPTNPNYGSNVSVHDPSIFQDTDGTYYAFGTHYAVAKSTDLQKWTQLATDGNSGRTLLFGLNSSQINTALGSQYTYAGTNDFWAPSVRKLGDKYYYYYCLSKFGTNNSIIGRAESTNVLGPYTNFTELLRTPLSDTSVNGLDPEIITSQDGKLWMVYGSFFAGIFIHELYNEGSNIGLLKTPGVSGTKLWHGGAGPEGPFIFYNPDTNYYYLMGSYGDLNDRYSMNVIRSRNINGPYRDIAGRDPSTATFAGVKLAGNYKFAGTSNNGYGAQGHNTLVVKDGHYVNVYHTRYGNSSGIVNGGSHNVRTSQIFFNQEGWPVMNTNRFAGEILQKVNVLNVAGNYDLIIHNDALPQTDAAKNVIGSTEYTFTEDYKILLNGLEVGYFELYEDYYIVVYLPLNGQMWGFDGVVTPVWDNDLTRSTLAITSTSGSGRALWANKK